MNEGEEMTMTPSEVMSKQRRDCEAGIRHLIVQGSCWYCEKTQRELDEGETPPVANGDKGPASCGPLEQIKAKCEQYSNEDCILSCEVHAILSFIHTRAVDAIAKIVGLEATVERQRGWPDASRLLFLEAKVERLEVDLKMADELHVLEYAEVERLRTLILYQTQILRDSAVQTQGTQT